MYSACSAASTVRVPLCNPRVAKLAKQAKQVKLAKPDERCTTSGKMPDSSPGGAMDGNKRGAAKGCKSPTELREKLRAHLRKKGKESVVVLDPITECPEVVVVSPQNECPAADLWDFGDEEMPRPTDIFLDLNVWPSDRQSPEPGTSGPPRYCLKEETNYLKPKPLSRVMSDLSISVEDFICGISASRFGKLAKTAMWTVVASGVMLLAAVALRYIAHWIVTIIEDSD